MSRCETPPASDEQQLLGLPLHVESAVLDNGSGVSHSVASPAIPYLDLFPTEIWLACWTLCSRRQLRRLVLVCKLFRDICVPLIFENQTIEAAEASGRDDWVERLQRLHRAAVRLDNIVDSPHARSVHSWKFVSNSFTSRPRMDILYFSLFESMCVRLLNTFSTTLDHYHNLRSLRLEALVIDAPFRQTFSKLSKLENLALHSCPIVARDGFVMSLHSFIISAKESGAPTAQVSRKPLRIVAPESLHALHLDAPHETAPLLAAFGHARFSHLVVLSLQHVSHLNMLLDLLAKCPKLEVLKITTIHRDLIASLPRYTLSPNTIPALRDLTVHGEMLGFFSLNRPIATATILNHLSTAPTRLRHRAPSVEYFSSAVLNDLLKASVPLLSLSISGTSPTLELLTSITSLFPQLKQLSIHLPQPRFERTNYFHRSGSASVDKRCPVLRDADALNDIPEDDLSDAEQDKPPSVTLVRAPNELRRLFLTDLHKIFHWICIGAASLPHEIEVLRFICNGSAPEFSLVVVEEHEIIATLSHLYAHLRELELPNDLWTREGAVWGKRDTDLYIQVVS